MKNKNPKFLLTIHNRYGTIYLSRGDKKSNYHTTLYNLGGFNMTKDTISTTLATLKALSEEEKELKKRVEALKSEVEDYMTEAELSELFNDDKSIKATYIEVISKRFDTTAFKKSEWSELYNEFSKQTTSMRFTLN